MVDDNLVAAIGAKRGLNSGRNRSAGVDIAKYSTIFGVVAIEKEIELLVGFIKFHILIVVIMKVAFVRRQVKRRGATSTRRGATHLL
jgi:hypothetical protein